MALVPIPYMGDLVISGASWLYIWVPRIYMLGATLRWTSILSGGWGKKSLLSTGDKRRSEVSLGWNNKSTSVFHAFVLHCYC